MNEIVERRAADAADAEDDRPHQLLHARDRRRRRGAAGRAGAACCCCWSPSSLDMVKRDDARGTWQESHFSWRIRSVLWAGGLYLVTVAALAAAHRSRAGSPGRVISVWFLYRIVARLAEPVVEHADADA